MVRSVRADGHAGLAVPRVAPPARPAARSRLTDVGETAAGAILGAALAAAAWSLVDLGVVAAVVGGLNGLIAGARRIYRWRSITGPLAFLLDSTWALITSAGALFVHAVALLQRVPGNYVTSLSERRDRHVYAAGLTLRRGFLTTVGNVVSGARRARRSAVIDVHEHVHVWQARWLGPLYPMLYGTWTVLGALAGAAVWLVRGRNEKLMVVIDTISYYSNPLEWWAYSREGRWPPPAAVSGLTWHRPLARPRRSV